MHKLFSQQPFIAVSASILIWLVLTVFFHLIGYPIVISVVLFLIFAHWIWVRHFSSSRILHLSLLLSLIIFSAHYLVLIYNFSPLIVPIPALIMLTVLLFKDLQLALTMSFVSSLIVTLILNQNMEFYLLHVVGGIASSFAIQNSRNRTQFLIAGFLISGAFILFQIFMHPYAAYYLSENFYTFQINPLLLNAFLSSFGVMVSLKIFEYLFGVITNYSLLELADFNHPLLKRMSLEAPGDISS